MSLFRGERPNLGPITVQADGTAPPITILNADGSTSSTIGSATGTFASATITNNRAIDAEPVLSATSTAITGSAAAVRGNTTVSAATTVTSGFLYGVQGKLTLPGTLSSANFSAALVGQLDLSANTALGTGPVAAIWGDMGATASAGAITGEAVLDVVLLTNTTAATINSAIHIEVTSTYLLDVSNASYSPWFHAGAPTTLSGSLKIKTSAGDRFIALYTTQ